MRELMQIEADPWLVAEALDAALDGRGPAILPIDVSAPNRQPVDVTDVADEIALVVETSGSTADPKRVLLSADALLASARATHDALGGPGQWLLALPVHYIAGLQVLTRSRLAGAPPVVAGADLSDPATLADAISRMSAPRRYAALVPVQLRAIVAACASDPELAPVFASLDAILVGGQQLDSALAEAAAALDLHIVRTYGSTETAGGCVYDGTPIGGARIALVDGLVRLAGPMLAAGYLDPRQTEARFVADGAERWWLANDRGEFDSEGRLRVLGRADDVIVSGGIKLSLGDVERVLHTLPGLASAVAVPCDDEKWGQGFVIAADGRLRMVRPADTDIAHALTSALGRAAIPRRVLWLERGIPLTSTGKPDRRALTRRIESKEDD